MVTTERIEAVEPSVVCTRPRGELWLKSAATGSYNQVLQAGQAATDNMLVLGPSGSGQGVLLGRLALNAYENGEVVVMLCLRQQKRALHQLTQTLGGAYHAWAAGEQIGFNPFLPVLDRPAYALHRLQQVLLAVLGAESGRNVEPHAPILFGLLEAYYAQRPWPKAGPDFSSFFTFVTATATRNWALAQWSRSEVALFMPWFTAVGRVFCAEEDLGYLLNAAPEDLAARLTPSNRLLCLEMGVSEVPEAAERQRLQYAVWLWLHAVDCYVATGERPATIILDELPGCCLQEADAAYWTQYLVHAPRHVRKLIMGWHLTPDHLFSPEHPAAVLHYEAFSYQFLLPASPYEFDHSMLWRSLTEKEKAELSSLSADHWQVFVRGNGRYGKYLVGMKPEELGLYLSDETLAGQSAGIGYLQAQPPLHL